MSDINNDGTEQYVHSMKMEDTATFLQVIYRNVKDVTKRQDLINLYFGEEDDNNIGDC
tara:strand:- start:230 stop:403 length:174 start_codon:yes stop_codon:yes gene_type:complete